MDPNSTSRREYLARTGAVMGTLSLGIGAISGSAAAQTEISEATVITEPGDYEVVDYLRSIQINADDVTLNGNGNVIGPITSTGTSNVTINNFIASRSPGVAVDFREVHNCTVENMDLSLMTRGGVGVSMTGSKNTVINSSFSHMRGTGVVVRGSKNTVTDNTCLDIYDGGNGIIIEGSNNIVEDNLSNGIYGSGIVLTGDKNRLRNNTITNAGNGRVAAIQLRDSNNNQLMNNTTTSNDWHGIGLVNSNNNRVIQNEATDNTIGIALQNSSRNTVVRNDVRDNEDADILDEGENNQVRANRTD